ncbi:hypothetical protein C8R45DRAFT_1094350 [Mycena sanguinolenta]|nr:hypothetical protein C8R45DRAFT_1094350 [Mycena sanguinolenta]
MRTPAVARPSQLRVRARVFLVLGVLSSRGSSSSSLSLVFGGGDTHRSTFPSSDLKYTETQSKHKKRYLPPPTGTLLAGPPLAKRAGASRAEWERRSEAYLEGAERSVIGNLATGVSFPASRAVSTHLRVLCPIRRCILLFFLFTKYAIPHPNLPGLRNSHRRARCQVEEGLGADPAPERSASSTVPAIIVAHPYPASVFLPHDETAVRAVARKSGSSSPTAAAAQPSGHFSAAIPLIGWAFADPNEGETEYQALYIGVGLINTTVIVPPATGPDISRTRSSETRRTLAYACRLSSKASICHDSDRRAENTLPTSAPQLRRGG